MKAYQKTFTLILIPLTSACTWVQLSDSGQQVRVANTSDIVTCKKIGNVSAKTRHELIKGSTRETKRIETELITLARNEAANIKANTIVVASPITQGSQTFVAYQCP